MKSLRKANEILHFLYLNPTKKSTTLNRPNGISGKGILRVLLFSEYLNCEVISLT